MGRRGRPRPKSLAATIAILALAAAFGWAERQGWLESGAGAGSEIERLFAEERSGVVVEGEGVVSKLLPDDREGSRHQRFVLRLDSGHTLLVSHNIDLAPRVEGLERGDVVAFRGQYEWNERGGVLHWTHHDPGGRRPGGWLRHAGRSFR